MEIDTKKAAKLEQLKKQLDDIAGRDVDVSADKALHFIFPIASQSYDDNGVVTYQRIFFPSKSCAQRRLLDVAGSSVTADDGKRVFLLTDFLCSTVNAFDAPVNLVVTPRSTTPFYVTTEYTLVQNPSLPTSFSDLQITVLSWNPNGSPAPGVAFDWRCRLISYPIIE
jgi:hypothetical protein